MTSFWDQAPLPQEPQQPDPVVIRPAPTLTKPPALYAFGEKQGLTAETIDAFGVGVTTHEFSTGRKPAIAFPFRDRHGDLVGYGYRPPEGAPREWDQNAAGVLYNAQDIETNDALWWAADELEVLALVQAGFRQTVACPCDLDTALRDNADQISEFTRITLALPSTPEGDKLVQDLAARLGRQRVWTVTWPDGCRSACDVLRLHGVERLEACVNAANPWPIEGIQYLRPGLLRDLRKAKPPPVLSTGTQATDAIMRFPGEGKLIIVTGIPGHGKTTWMRYVMIHTALNHDRRWLCFSPENAPWERFLAECAEVYVGAPFHRRRLPTGGYAEAMSDEDLANAEQWLRPRVTMLVDDSQDQPPSLDWIFDRGARSVLRDGTTDILVDPWNEVEHSRPERMSETEYVGLSLQRSRAFCNRYRCNMWIVAHPKVQIAAKPGAKLPPPGLYDISGGANWANKADLGVCVYTPDNEFTQILLLKSKARRWGQRNSKGLITFDPRSGRYYTQRPIIDGLETHIEENE